MTCATMGVADTVPLSIRAPVGEAALTLPSLPPETPAVLPLHRVRLAVEPASDWKTALAAHADLSAFGFPCTPKLSVTAQAGAMYDIIIAAPCRPDQTVRMTHGGVGFDLRLSMTGDAAVTLPALAASGKIETVFADGLTLSQPVSAPDLDAYARVAVAWGRADAGWLAGSAPRHLPASTLVLGDGTGQMAHVLTHPIDPEARPGVIRLSLVTRVTKANCAQDRKGKVVHLMPGQPPLRYDLALSPTGCDQIGRNLELKNILQDLKLAAH